MITRTKLHSSFVQYVHTCILGSYAIASNYYTGIPLLAFFKDFAKHFNSRIRGEDLWDYFVIHPGTPSDPIERMKLYSDLTDLNKYEIVYDHFFHKEYKSGRASGGLSLIKELHDKSKQKSFEASRDAFSLCYIQPVEDHIANVENRLDSEESLLMVAFRGEKEGSRHISVVGHDTIGSYMIETRPNKSNGAVGIPHILSLPEVGDALLTIQLRDKQEKGS